METADTRNPSRDSVVTDQQSRRLASSGLRAVAVVGSSVSLYVRPPRAVPQAGTYVELLARMLGPQVRVTNLSRVSYDLRDAVDHFSAVLLPLSPDIVVLHLGVNECVSRFLPRRLWRYVHGADDAHGGPGLIRSALGQLDAVIRGLYTRVVKRAWFSEQVFEDLVLDLLGRIRKELSAKVVVVGITQPSARVEQQLKGSQARARRFNVILERCAASAGATFVSIEVDEHAELHPDGIHFSADGHRWLAERLYREFA